MDICCMVPRRWNELGWSGLDKLTPFYSMPWAVRESLCRIPTSKHTIREGVNQYYIVVITQDDLFLDCLMSMQYYSYLEPSVSSTLLVITQSTTNSCPSIGSNVPYQSDFQQTRPEKNHLYSL